MHVRPLILLVTGFGPFPGAPNNPSAKIVQALDARRLARIGVQLHRRILPVVFEGAAQRLAGAIEEIRPDGVLHLGLAGRRKTLGVETRARNLHSMFHVDAQRSLPASRAIVCGGADIRRARFPVVQAMMQLTAAGARAQSSIDAGRYACNQTLYLTLGCQVRLVGFIHIPRPRGRKPLARVARKTIKRACMVRGVEAVLREMARALRRQ